MRLKYVSSYVKDDESGGVVTQMKMEISMLVEVKNRKILVLDFFFVFVQLRWSIKSECEGLLEAKEPKRRWEKAVKLKVSFCLFMSCWKNLQQC